MIKHTPKTPQVYELDHDRTNPTVFKLRLNNDILDDWYVLHVVTTNPKHWQLFVQNKPTEYRFKVRYAAYHKLMRLHKEHLSKL